MELCVGFTSDEWRNELRPKLDGSDTGAWEEAITVFERRLEERFFRCIESLFKLDQQQHGGEPVRPGFSIMALCCLLVDSLQSFYDGGRGTDMRGVHEATVQTCVAAEARESTARSFKNFLKNSRHFNRDFANSEVRGDFATKVRNAILHEAETRSGWLIERTIPRGRIVEKTNGDGYILNRTLFYEALRSEFNDYLDRLHHNSEEKLRHNFLKKMDEICESEPGISEQT